MKKAVAIRQAGREVNGEVPTWKTEILGDLKSEGERKRKSYKSPACRVQLQMQVQIHITMILLDFPHVLYAWASWTPTIATDYKEQFLVVAINFFFLILFLSFLCPLYGFIFSLYFTLCTSYAASISYYFFLVYFFTYSMYTLFTFYALLSLSLHYSILVFLEIQYFFNSLSRWAMTVLSLFLTSNTAICIFMSSPIVIYSWTSIFLFFLFFFRITLSIYSICLILSLVPMDLSHLHPE